MRVTPARPRVTYTGDGRRVHEVLTYVRRGGRMSAADQQAWDAGRHLVLEAEQVEDGLDLPVVFGRAAPLVVEVGSGVGEATAALAARRPECDVLAFEVWRPGVAQALRRVTAAGLTNVRFVVVDAVWAVENLLAPQAVRELWTFFPDPWPKTRWHRRRLVNPAFARVAAERLEPGGTWRLATDWAEYASRMQQVLDAEPLLAGGVVPRWAERPETRFERKGRNAGRTTTDLAYRRI